MLIFGLYAIILVLILKYLGFFRLNDFKGWCLYLVLIAKLLLAILLYHFPYETIRDSQIYLHDSKVLSQLFFHSPKDFFVLFFNLTGSENLDLAHMLETNYWSHETSGFLSEKRNTIRINAIFQIIGLQNVYIVFLWNIITSMLGLKLFYLALRKFANDPKNLWFIGIFLLPSTLLWTSNIMKESYLLLGLGLFFYGILHPKTSFKSLIITASGLLIMLMFKQYVAIGFGFGTFIYAILVIKNRKLKFMAISLSLVLCVLLLSSIYSKITERISQKQFDFVQLAQGGIVLKDGNNNFKIKWSQKDKLHFFEGNDKNLYAKIIQPVIAKKENYIGKSENIPLQASEKQWYVIVYSDASGSKIDVTPIRNSPSQLVKNIPEALFNVGLRPLPNDPPKSVFKWYFIFENILLWVIFLFALTKLKTSRNKEIVILFLISSLIIALFIGWTTPVIGAIIRYKMPVVLSLIAVSWLLLSPKNNISDKSFL